MRQRRPDGADVAHHVELPGRVPLVVGNVLEACDAGDPDVVDEDVEASEDTRRFVHDTRRLVGADQVGDDVRRLSHLG